MDYRRVKELQEYEDYLISLDGLTTISDLLPPKSKVEPRAQQMHGSSSKESIMYSGENPNWPSKTPGQSGGLGRGNNPPK